MYYLTAPRTSCRYCNNSNINNKNNKNNMYHLPAPGLGDVPHVDTAENLGHEHLYSETLYTILQNCTVHTGNCTRDK